MLFLEFTNALISVFAPISIPARAAALAACASQLHELNSIDSKNVSRNFHPPAVLLTPFAVVTQQTNFESKIK
jgi:hypothetical protein